MTSNDPADEAALERFFAAARADRPEPPLRLLNAVLADAAEVAAARQAPQAPAVPARPWWRHPRLLEPIAGWRGLATLGACAVFGFWVGIAGGITVDDGTVWAGTATVASDEAATDPVGEFFDLASVEN